jgi:hypothetical protein
MIQEGLLIKPYPDNSKEGQQVVNECNATLANTRTKRV